MKKEELIVGEIYRQDNFIFEYCDHKNNTKGNIGYGNYIYIICTDQYFVKQREVYNPSSHLVKPATQKEKNWLNACIEANKFIPFDEVNQSINYEIY